MEIKVIRLGTTIKRLRKAQKLTLTELARRSGIQMATLSRLENNKMAGTLNCHIELARALGMKLSEFFEEYEKDRMSKSERHFLVNISSHNFN